MKGPVRKPIIGKNHNGTAPELRAWAPPAKPKIEIRFAYDDIKGNYIENDISNYEYYEITKTEYQISLLPTGEGLQSLLEAPSKNNEQPDMGAHYKTVTQQVHSQTDQEGDGSSEVTGTITLITKNEDHAQTSLIEAFFNGDGGYLLRCVNNTPC